MDTPASILFARTITIDDAAGILEAFPEILERLAAIAAKRMATSTNVRIRTFTATDVLNLWDSTLNKIVVGLVFYDTIATMDAGRSSVSIDRRMNRLIVDDW